MNTATDEQLITIKIDASSDELIPVYQTEGASGADLKANLKEPIVLAAHGARVLVPTGIRIEIPQGFEVQIRPRSGLALKHGITVLNSPGTIDSDYRGEIQVILINHSDTDFILTHGMRIAQMVVAPVSKACFVPSCMLASSVREKGGFGHTGTN